MKWNRQEDSDHERCCQTTETTQEGEYLRQEIGKEQIQGVQKVRLLYYLYLWGFFVCL